MLLPLFLSGATISLLPCAATLTSPDYRSTTEVLQKYYKVLQNTTKYYRSTTEVLQKYCNVPQSTTKRPLYTCALVMDPTNRPWCTEYKKIGDLLTNIS